MVLQIYVDGDRRTGGLASEDLEAHADVAVPRPRLNADVAGDDGAVEGHGDGRGAVLTAGEHLQDGRDISAQTRVFLCFVGHCTCSPKQLCLCPLEKIQIRWPTQGHRGL